MSKFDNLLEMMSRGIEHERELMWLLAEATCVIDLMMAECSVPCVAETYSDIECSIVHISPELCDRACRVFNDGHRRLPRLLGELS